MMTGARCPRCGAGIGTGSSFCPYCGAQLGQALGQPMGQPMARPMGQTTGPSYNMPSGQGRIVPQLSTNAYIIDQKILAIRDTFAVKDRSGNLLAYVKQQLLSFGPKFWYEDTNGQNEGKRLGARLQHPRHIGSTDCPDPQEVGLGQRLLRYRDFQHIHRPVSDPILRDQLRSYREERKTLGVSTL